MGKEFKAKCKKCGEIFNVREGGGKETVLFHCDTCGKEKVIRQSELDKNVPLIDNSGIPYKKRIEDYAGSCGEGKYKLGGKPRCPKCKSEEYVMYDEKDGKASVAYYD